MVVSKTGFYLVQKKNKRAIPLNDGVMIGRGNDCKIVIKDERVSSNHLKLIVTAGECFVVDLNTKNGTIINDQRIPSNEKIKLYHNDILMLGKYKFQFVDEKLTTRLGGNIEDGDKTSTSVGLSITQATNNVSVSSSEFDNLSLSSVDINSNDEIDMRPDLNDFNSVTGVSRLTESRSHRSKSPAEALLLELRSRKHEKESRYKVKESEVEKLINSKKEFIEKQKMAKDLFDKIKIIEAKRFELDQILGSNLNPDIEVLNNEIVLNNDLKNQTNVQIIQLEKQILSLQGVIQKYEGQNELIQKKINSANEIQEVEDELQELKDEGQELKYYNDYNLTELERKLSIKENERQQIKEEYDKFDEKIMHQEKKVKIEQESMRRLHERQLQKEIVKLQRKLDSVKKK